MSDDQFTRPASTDAQLARLGERMHALANKMQETNAGMKEMSLSIREVTKEFNNALVQQSERFLHALKEQGERHQAAVVTVQGQMQELMTKVVMKGEVNQSWLLAQAVAKLVGWATAIGLFGWTLIKAGAVRP